jgi:outer membrane protein TolC
MRPQAGKTLLFIAVAMASLSACSTIKVDALSEQALREHAVEGMAVARADVVPIIGTLSLDEAVARAIKYNLDRRAKLLEEALAFQMLDVAHYDMLPALVAQAGYTWRDNDRISQSVNVEDGTPAPSRFTSQERAHTVSSLSLSWSMLDLGVGYFATRQQADRVLIAVEQRRKAMHLLKQDVRTAFWRAYSAQVLLTEIQETVRLAESALADSRQVTLERLRNPIDTLRYQRQLLESLRLLEAISQELSAAEIELAALINAPVGEPIRLAAPAEFFDRGALDVPVEMLEEIALISNPDVRESLYNARIAREETRRTMARLFPNVVFNYGVNYDTDKFLVNNSWRDAGAQISFNLFNLLTGRQQLKLAEAGVDLADQRRVAMQMAVVAQVHLARLSFGHALQQLHRAQEIADTDRHIAELTSERADAALQSDLDRVSNRTTYILSQLRRYQALAEAHAAEARLQATVGNDPEIGSVDMLALEELISALAESHSLWQAITQVGEQP